MCVSAEVGGQHAVDQTSFAKKLASARQKVQNKRHKMHKNKEYDEEWECNKRLVK